MDNLKKRVNDVLKLTGKARVLLYGLDQDSAADGLGDAEDFIAELAATLKPEGEQISGEVVERADMFWDLDGGDDCYGDPADYADMSGEKELIFEMSCAKKLPNKWFAARYVDDEGWKVSAHDTSEEAEQSLEIKVV